MAETKTKIKTELKVILMAGDQVIAEDDCPMLWQQVFARITSQTEESATLLSNPPPDGMVSTGKKPDEIGTLPLSRFAGAIRVDVNLLQGACDPTEDEPFIRIDHRTWSGWKKQIPARGKGAVSGFALCATIIALWFKELDKSPARFAQVKPVMDKLNEKSFNLSRCINSCEWLQLKDNKTIILHPSHIGKAENAVRFFVNVDSGIGIGNE